MRLSSTGFHTIERLLDKRERKIDDLYYFLLFIQFSLFYTGHNLPHDQPEWKNHDGDWPNGGKPTDIMEQVKTRAS